jgi:hypothetical protein
MIFDLEEVCIGYGEESIGIETVPLREPRCVEGRIVRRKDALKVWKRFRLRGDASRGNRRERDSAGGDGGGMSDDVVNEAETLRCGRRRGGEISEVCGIGIDDSRDPA